MPWFDGTGPYGMGPLTGRKQGRCVSSNGGTLFKKQVSRNGRTGKGFRRRCFCLIPGVIGIYYFVTNTIKKRR